VLADQCVSNGGQPASGRCNASTGFCGGTTVCCDGDPCLNSTAADCEANPTGTPVQNATCRDGGCESNCQARDPLTCIVGCLDLPLGNVPAPPPPLPGKPPHSPCDLSSECESLCCCGWDSDFGFQKQCRFVATCADLEGTCLQ
jgi:hypothetical protein